MRNLILVASLLLSFGIHANVVVVSDIDDTVKVAHVRDFKGLIRNAFKVNNRFLGMSDLLRSLQDDNEAEIIYLTNAPKKIMKWSHTTLLKNGNFPGDKVYFRDDLSSDEHKTKTLRKIIEDKRPTKMILFGDNGEKDIYFYETIKNEYPSIDFTIFIRTVYNLDKDHTPLPGQFPYVTPFEVANTLDKLGLINQESIDELYRKHAINLLSESRNVDEGPMYLPKWMKCRGFQISDYLDGHFSIDLSIRKKINKICKSK